jgi:hypothetical protein
MYLSHTWNLQGAALRYRMYYTNDRSAGICTSAGVVTFLLSTMSLDGDY